MKRKSKTTISELKIAYDHQRSGAKKRGIEWQFTFKKWLRVWHDSGHLHERGNFSDQYVMARNGDVGPYSADNVRIITTGANLSEAWQNGLYRKHRKVKKVGQISFDELLQQQQEPVSGADKANDYIDDDIIRIVARELDLVEAAKNADIVKWNSGSWKTKDAPEI